MQGPTKSVDFLWHWPHAQSVHIGACQVHGISALLEVRSAYDFGDASLDNMGSSQG